MTADTFWWQTSWARLVAGLPVGLPLWAVCSFRMRWAVRQYDLRLEERMRIARELHDTLLQGRLSAHMQLHIAVGRLRSNDPRGGCSALSHSGFVAGSNKSTARQTLLGLGRSQLYYGQRSPERGAFLSINDHSRIFGQPMGVASSTSTPLLSRT